MKYFKTIKLLSVLFLLVLLYGCNKQKAEAIKIAVENFRSEAILSLEQMNFLFIKNVSVAINTSKEDEINKIVQDLFSIENINNINADLLDHWTNESNIGADIINSINTEFEDIKSQYYHFEALFNSIEKGNLLNKKSVKKTEKYAINLTLQLINFSKALNDNLFRFTSNRVLLIEKMKQAYREENQELKIKLLESVATEFVELRIEENQTKGNAIKQCLKAAECGRMVAELIKDYDKLKVSDMLNSIKNSMNYIIQISGENEKISELLVKFEGVEKTIKEDPYWKIILSQSINQ